MVRRKVATKRRQRPPRISVENEALTDHGKAIWKLNEELNRVAGTMATGFPTGLFGAIREVVLSYNAVAESGESIARRQVDPEARKLIAVGAVLGAFDARDSSNELTAVVEEMADAFGLTKIEVEPPATIPADYIDLRPAVPPPPDSCPHGVDLANDECDACMRASDEAYDAARERGRA